MDITFPGFVLAQGGVDFQKVPTPPPKKTFFAQSLATMARTSNLVLFFRTSQRKLAFCEAKALKATELVIML